MYSALRLIRLKKFFNMFHGCPELDTISEALLEKILLNWDDGLRISSGELISSCKNIGSHATLVRRLKNMEERGLIQLRVEKFDKRVKIPVPTQETLDHCKNFSYFVESCFKESNIQSESTDLPLNDFAISQAYLEASKPAIMACSMSLSALEGDHRKPNIASKVCRNICSQEPYICSFIGLIDSDVDKSIQLIAIDGVAREYGRSIHLSCNFDNEYGAGPTGMAIRNGRTIVLSDIEFADNFSPWLNQARTYGIRSGIFIPLMANKKSFGILNVYSGEPHSFGPTEIYLFESLAQKLTSYLHPHSQEQKLQPIGNQLSH